MTLIDPRLTKQAEVLVDHSVKIKEGENVIIAADFEARPLVLEIYRLLIKRGAGEVRLQFSGYEFSEVFLKNATNSQIKHFPQIAMDEMKDIQCYIAIKSSTNLRGLTGIDANKISERSKIVRPIQDYRVEKTKWVVSEFPTNAQAQEADMSLSEYEDFVFDAINGVDWKKKFKEQEKLCRLVNSTKKVRIVGEETDLTLDITGRKAINAGGEYNMPDGEVFTSVVENGADGYIKYTFPAIYMGREFTNVCLEFKKGKVIKATSDKNKGDLNKIIDMDAGGRTIGELGIGNNFGITKFTKNILFDEKIGGTIHLALGKGYKETLSKNVSALHWDMIKDLRNGGELWFDNKLVQSSGKWLFK